VKVEARPADVVVSQRWAASTRALAVPSMTAPRVPTPSGAAQCRGVVQDLVFERLSYAVYTQVLALAKQLAASSSIDTESSKGRVVALLRAPDEAGGRWARQSLCSLMSQQARPMAQEIRGANAFVQFAWNEAAILASAGQPWRKQASEIVPLDADALMGVQAAAGRFAASVSAACASAGDREGSNLFAVASAALAASAIPAIGWLAQTLLFHPNTPQTPKEAWAPVLDQLQRSRAAKAASAAAPAPEQTAAAAAVGASVATAQAAVGPAPRGKAEQHAPAQGAGGTPGGSGAQPAAAAKRSRDGDDGAAVPAAVRPRPAAGGDADEVVVVDDED